MKVFTLFVGDLLGGDADGSGLKVNWESQIIEVFRIENIWAFRLVIKPFQESSFWGRKMTP